MAHLLGLMDPWYQRSVLSLLSLSSTILYQVDHVDQDLNQVDHVLNLVDHVLYLVDHVQDRTWSTCAE